MCIRECAKRKAARRRSCQVFAAQLLAPQAQKNTRADTKKNFYPTTKGDDTDRGRALAVYCWYRTSTVVLGYGTVGTVVERETY